MQKVILSDVDGVLVDWVSTFETWMHTIGYKFVSDDLDYYSLKERFGMTDEKIVELIEFFNMSVWMEKLPPERDAIKYVRKLHEEEGYVFSLITSFSGLSLPIEFRKRNLENLFGKTAILDVNCIPIRTSKIPLLKEAHMKYGSCFWVEDHLQNAADGEVCGHKPIVMAHAYNVTDVFPRFRNWAEIYNHIKEHSN